MEFIISAYTWVQSNWQQLLIAAITLVATLETVVNLFPTKSGAGGLKRVGEFLDKMRDKAGLPVVLKKPEIKLKDDQ